MRSALSCVLLIFLLGAGSAAAIAEAKGSKSTEQGGIRIKHSKRVEKIKECVNPVKCIEKRPKPKDRIGLDGDDLVFTDGETGKKRVVKGIQKKGCKLYVKRLPNNRGVVVNNYDFGSSEDNLNYCEVYNSKGKKMVTLPPLKKPNYVSVAPDFGCYFLWESYEEACGGPYRIYGRDGRLLAKHEGVFAERGEYLGGSAKVTYSQDGKYILLWLDRIGIALFETNGRLVWEKKNSLAGVRFYENGPFFPSGKYFMFSGFFDVGDVDYRDEWRLLVYSVDSPEPIDTVRGFLGPVAMHPKKDLVIVSETIGDRANFISIYSPKSLLKKWVDDVFAGGEGEYRNVKWLGNNVLIRMMRMEHDHTNSSKIESRHEAVENSIEKALLFDTCCEEAIWELECPQKNCQIYGLDEDSFVIESGDKAKIFGIK